MDHKGRLLQPTLVFALYLMGAAAVGVLLVVGWREFGLLAGWTASSAAAAVAALGLSAAAGSALLGPRFERTARPAAVLGALFALLVVAVLVSNFLTLGARAAYPPLWPLLGATGAGTWGLRCLLALALMAIPAAIASCMPPILARLIVSRPAAGGLGFGFALGLSLAGLGLGIAIAGGLLLPGFGTGGGFLIGLALAGLAGGGIVLLAQRGAEGAGSIGDALAGENLSAPLGGPSHAGPGQGSGSPLASRLGVVLIGFVAWVYIIIWARALSFVVGGALPARAVTLGIILAALAAGSILAAGLADRLRRPLVAMAAILAASSLAAAASMYLMPQVALLYLRLTPLLAKPGFSLLPVACAATALVLPPCLFLGGVVPFLPLAEGSRERTWPRIAALLVAGIMLAEMVVGLVMIPSFGLRRALAIAAAFGLLAALLFISTAVVGTAATSATVALALLGLMVGLGGFPATWDPRVVTAGLYRYGARSISRFGTSEQYLAARRGVSIDFYREGVNATVIVERVGAGGPGSQPGQSLALTIDGRVEATTGQDVRTQVLQAHIPILVHGPTESVLLVDFLNGVAAGSILRHPIKQLTVIEREPVVFDASGSFSAYNNHPLDDGRLVRIADTPRARLFADPARYDVIILATLDPWLPHSASMSTSEGYAIAKSRLLPGGVLAQRVALSAMPEPALRALLRTFAGSFRSVLLFQISADDLLLLGSADPLGLDVAWCRNIIGSNGDLAQDLRRVVVTGPNELLHTFLLSGETLRTYLGEGPENGDDRAAVEFASARDLTVHRNDRLRVALEGTRSPILPVIRDYGSLPQEKAQFLYNLAKSFLGVAGDPIRAEEIARDLEGLGKPAMARWIRGEARLQQMDIDGALQEWQAVLDLEPGNLDPLFSLGTFYLDGRDYRKSEKYLARAARLFPEVAVVRYHYGRDLFYLGRYQEAIAELKEARRLGGEREAYPLVGYLAGVSYSRLGSNAAAAGELEDYLKWAYRQQELTGLEVDAHLQLAEIYDKQGKRFEAHKERQKANDLSSRLQDYARQQASASAATAMPAEGAGPPPPPARP